MQCFQKDPNLRVSAKKLLKHPWILSAKRTDSVLSTKPYDEAVKSVQQWNEALKSPDHGSIRRAARQVSSPVPPTGEAFQSAARAASKAAPASGKARPNPDLFRSPDAESSDNWDDDFATSISPSALRLPHLRPHDNFAGLLSSEKLKAYANAEGAADDSYDAGSTLKSPIHLTQLDPMETVRPLVPAKANSSVPKYTGPVVTSPRKSSQPNTQMLRSIPSVSAQRPKPPSFNRPSAIFRENSVEDYSDLIAPDDQAFQHKLEVMKVFNPAKMFGYS